MHDPMTVAFEIRNPFVRRGEYREPLATIWHVDPERDGSDDSCDWFNRGAHEDKAEPKRLAVYEALWDMETLLDNRPHFPDSPEHKAFQPLKAAIRAAFAPTPRSWWRHPRWHFWHWSIQIHPLQRLRRRLLTRCEKCGKGFSKGESPIGQWSSPPNRWFEFLRGERGLWHFDCDDTSK